MMYGTEGEVQGRWFKVNAGPRRRFHGRFPTVSEWDAYQGKMNEARTAPARPIDPATPTVDIVKFYQGIRPIAAACMTGLEVDGDIGEFSVAAALDLGPYQEPFFDFAGYLFRDASSFCDDGSGSDTGAA